MTDFYKVLAVDRTARDEQLKVAFRKLAMTCHPDLHGGDKGAEKRFKEVRFAYETLRSPERRATYDHVCAKARRLTFRRRRSAIATMAGSFVLTLSSGWLVGFWLVTQGLL